MRELFYHVVHTLNTFLIVSILLGGTLFIILQFFPLKSDTTLNTTPQDNSHQSSKSTEPTPLKFAVFSDTEDGVSLTRDVVEALKENDYRFIIHTGDLFNTTNFKPKDYTDTITAINELKPQPYFVAGNHDLDTITRLPVHPHYFDIPENTNSKLYYSFNYDDVHFVVLNNADRLVGFDEMQLEWLSKDLASAQVLHDNIAKEQQLSSSPLRVVYFMHRPIRFPLSDLYNDDETKKSRTSIEKFIQIIEPYETLHIFAGHIHAYFDYALPVGTHDIPVTIVGGVPSTQSIGTSTSRHYLDVKIDNNGKVEIQKIGVQ